MERYKDLRLLVDILLLTIGHMLNIKIIILIALIYFVKIVIDSPNEDFIPIMLFYLPWSPVMKFSPNSFTWFTFIIPIFFFYNILSKIKNKKEVKFSLKNVILVLAIIVLTLFVKLISGYEVDFNYMIFMFMLIFIPTYIEEYKDSVSFEKCIILFSIGIIMACISSGILSKYPHMLSYIDIYEWENVGLTRLSGFYGDANFYSAHILVAIFGLLTIIICDKGDSKKTRNIILFVSVIALIYCGFLSVSKMFLLTLIIGIITWIIASMISKQKLTLKLNIVFIVVISIIFIFSSDLFIKQLGMYSTRFNMVDNISDLTTGRSDIFLSYISFLNGNVLDLLLGQGYTNIFGEGISKASHNTIIQIIYQFGILGLILIFLWIINLGIIMKVKQSYNYTKVLIIIMFSIGCFLPWLSLDILYFDEFFYILSLFYIFKRYIINTKNI